MKKILAIAALFLAGAFAQPGATVYQSCAGCHQTSGVGIPGVFPPLAGHIPQVLTAKGGRQYLIKVVLFGLQGEIMVKGQKFNGSMPVFVSLKDADIAAVLNYISTQWGNKFPAGQKPFTDAEVKALRASKLTPAQVAEVRKKLGLK